MNEPIDDLEQLWKTGSDSEHQLHREVIGQARRWWFVLSIECLAICIGIVVPILVVARTPEPFWIVWAADLWGVVLISAWFVYLRIKDLLVDLDQSTDAYVTALHKRHTLQIRAARIGIFLALFQFLFLPLLGWWQTASLVGDVGRTIVTYAAVLGVMAIYIGVMARVVFASKTKLLELGLS